MDHEELIDLSRGIQIIAPGSQTTLAQHGLPESFTPARLRFKSRMFPAEREDEWEAVKIRKKLKVETGGHGKNGVRQDTTNGQEEIAYEEDPESDDGAVWPIVNGRITSWSCFYALMHHVHNAINPSIHTPILLISQPSWTARELEKITQFFFEKFKIPAFGLMDSALATCYAYGVPSATIVDVGLGKTDITAVSDFLVQDTGRAIAVPDCGGEAMTQRLLGMLKSKDFSRDMCEQLKKSAICEILPPGTQLPGATEAEGNPKINPAAAASTGADGPGLNQRNTAAARGEAPSGLGHNTEVGEEPLVEQDNEGVLDVVSVVAGGNMNEFLAQREKQKAERAASKKKGSAAGHAPVKPVRLANAQRETNTFFYEDYSLHNAVKSVTLNGKRVADMEASADEGRNKRQKTPETPETPKNPDTEESQVNQQPDTHAHADVVETLNGTSNQNDASLDQPIRREIEVGTERFGAASGGLLERIADAIYRTVLSVEEVGKRSELWDSLIVVGNGSKVRGFKEALMATLTSKYLISPSSATIFTSELPSNLSTPAATGANTPQPGQYLSQAHASHVNPLLLAATTAQNPNLLHPGSSLVQQHQNNLHQHHSSHGQTPTSIKFAKVPEYFPEWKDFGMEEAHFLGAQVGAKVLFVVDGGLSKGFMSRVDYNEQGPGGINDYSM